MNIKITSLLVLLLLLVGCSENNEQGTEMDAIDNNNESSEESDQTEVDEQDPTEADEPDEQEPVFSEPEVIAENLEIPWAIEKIDYTFYLTERPGYITRIENGESVRQTVELNEAVSTVPEAGLLGFVLDPDFLENSTAYAYYTYEDSNGPMNRIVALQFNEEVW